jgi:hypothetical protein
MLPPQSVQDDSIGRGPARGGMVDADDADETMTRRSLKRASEFFQMFTG